MTRALQQTLAAIALTLLAAHAEAATFSSHEVEIITRYYHDVAGEAGQPAAKPLPRGIAKNLKRGKTMPPGIAKQQLPAPLVRELPPPPAGFERIVVAGKILLVEIATQAVHDVLTDVLFR
jgi:hypothetical protein